MKIKRLLILMAALTICSAAYAQQDVDSTYLGVDILSLINQKGRGTATVNQSYDLRNALSRHIVANSGRKMQGYRVRIFFDSDRTARAKSEAIATEFENRYPGVRAYRSHVSPYFKVTVGDFRTRADAQRFASRLTNSGAYRYVFVVKEQINFPGF
ncbi:MAG: SPOR domain-containing protein [Bacteroidales bacterium]|nr:SPOR domain-containing protein [Bacteroidales bacterium]MBR0501493.1 SPOR domain-containing protein [Bacteroidales bacterium]MBR6212182.1 SPOR domain-containing protein [Bacteroidales bacterium]